MAIVGISRRSKWLVAARAIVCGLIAGILVTCYRQGMGSATQFARWMYAGILGNPWLIIPWVLVALAVGVFVGWLVKSEPMASGSGIPQVEGVVRMGFKMRWFAVLGVRFLGGLLCGMFGLSLGREGPSIQIGAAASQGVAKGMKRRHDETDVLITAGAAAGLSAAFSAPLSGLMFALEEVHHSFTPAILLSAASAAISADIVSKWWFGLTPVLDFGRLPQFSLPQYWWMLPLGLVAGLVGTLMNRMLLGFQTLYNRLPWPVRPVIALGLALPVGLLLPQVLGGGANLIGFAERPTGGLALLLILLAVKMVFTATSFGSGVPGGIFMPILAVGTLAGSVCGLALNAIDVAGSPLLPAKLIPVFAVCAMAGTLTASVKAPLTSILLVVEMSGTLMHMLPVAACSFVALMVSDLLGIDPIYDALLDRYVASHPVGGVEGPRRSGDRFSKTAE